MPDLDQHTLTRNSCLILFLLYFLVICLVLDTQHLQTPEVPVLVSSPLTPTILTMEQKSPLAPRGQKENLGAAPRALVVLLNSGKVEFAEQLSRLDVCYLWSKYKNLWFKCQWTQWLPVSSTEEEKGDVRAPLQPFVS